jgi:hypothetical protein
MQQRRPADETAKLPGHAAPRFIRISEVHSSGRDSVRFQGLPTNRSGECARVGLEVFDMKTDGTPGEITPIVERDDPSSNFAAPFCTIGGVDLDCSGPIQQQRYSGGTVLADRTQLDGRSQKAAIAGRKEHLKTQEATRDFKSVAPRRCKRKFQAQRRRGWEPVFGKP